MNEIKIISDNNRKALKIKNSLKKILSKSNFRNNNLVIVIGGDGFMLKTLKKNINKNKLFFGINSGNYGFLMNKFSPNKIIRNIKNSKITSITPLMMIVKNIKNQIKKYLAINEVSILRQSRQTAFLSISCNSEKIIKKLISDGVLVSTPAGSTAYNFSVSGPILDLNSKNLSICPISPFRPRRWKGRIVNNSSKIVVRNLDPSKRPVSAVADNFEVRNAKTIKITSYKKIKFNLLFDPSTSLQKKNNIELNKKETY